MRHFSVLLLTTLALSFGACNTGGDDDDPADCRESSVDPSDSYYDRYEGTTGDNSCTVDEDCVLGGCSSEVCAAESMSTDCEVIPLPTGTCGCVEGECSWYSECSG